MNRWLTVLVLVFALIFVAACTPIPPPAAEADAARTGITFLISGDATDEAAYRQLVAAFAAEHGEIAVDLINIPSGGDFRKRLAADFAAGTPPDLFLINYRNLGRFLASGAVAPLTGYIAGSTLIKPSDYYPQALGAFQWHGEQACMPQNISSPVIYYNKDLFDAAGVAYPAGEWTWDEFLAAAQQLTQDSDGDGVYDVYGFGAEPTIVRMAPFVWMNGGDLVDNRSAPARLALDAPASREALQWFIDLQTTHHVVPDAVAEEAESSLSRFVNGRMAMFMDSRRAVPEFRLIETFDWDVAALPAGKERATILHSDAFCLAAASKRKDAAWTFLEFASSTAGQTLLAQTGRTVPSRRDLAQSPVFLDPQARPANSQAFLDAIPTIRSLPIMAAWSDIEGILNTELQNAFYGAAALDDALRAADQRSAEFFE